MPAPGFGREGRRGLQESKPFLSELNKIFHTVKAQHTERRPASLPHSSSKEESGKATSVGKDKARKPREFADKAAWKAHMKAMRQTHKQRRNNRKSSGGGGGGSIWITLKGGFAAQNVAHTAKGAREAAEARVRLSLRRRRAALELAEAYVQSAWEQAREAGLVARAANTSNAQADASQGAATSAEGPAAGKLDACAALVPARAVSEDGAQYLQEQYAVAATHLALPDLTDPSLAPSVVVGAHMQRLIAAHSESAAPPARLASKAQASHKAATANEEEEESEGDEEEEGETNESGLRVPEEPTVLSRAEWTNLLLREYLIAHAIFTHEGRAEAEAAVGEAMQTVRNPEAVYYLSVAEPCLGKKDRSASQAAQRAGAHAHEEGAAAPAAAAEECCEEDIVPTKCIVHVCNSQRQKATTILSKTKDVNVFVSNFMQAVRKELGSSCLPRGPTETTESNTNTNTTAAAASVAGGHATPTPAATRNAGNAGAAGHAGKSNTRRKRR